MNIVGPSRLILLRSGKYDYGEIELITPLHLIGPNNVGKTSLIAVLQFLYIDDQRSMHFSREMSETRKYYFPDQNSYILFECLTQTGYQVVGVQGLAPSAVMNFNVSPIRECMIPPITLTMHDVSGLPMKYDPVLPPEIFAC